jgi:hypothetical protein
MNKKDLCIFWDWVKILTALGLIIYITVLIGVDILTQLKTQTDANPNITVFYNSLAPMSAKGFFTAIVIAVNGALFVMLLLKIKGGVN